MFKRPLGLLVSSLLGLGLGNRAVHWERLRLCLRAHIWQSQQCVSLGSSGQNLVPKKPGAVIDLHMQMTHPNWSVGALRTQTKGQHRVRGQWKNSVATGEASTYLSMAISTRTPGWQHLPYLFWEELVWHAEDKGCESCLQATTHFMRNKDCSSHVCSTSLTLNKEYGVRTAFPQKLEEEGRYHIHICVYVL